jgi:uncharacterized protein (DUF362 family)
MGSVFVSGTDEFNVYNSIRKHMRSLKVDFSFKIAVIKLNLCSLKLRETGATSDPIVVEQIVKFLNEQGVGVKLVESNSASKDADLAFKYLGFKQLEKKYDVKCVNLSRDSFETKKIDGYHLKSIRVPQTIGTAEFFISQPKLKTHPSMRVHLTGALKNQFGCLMEKNKAVHHPFIHEVIADVNLAFKPDLTIMDGIIAMIRYGPTNGSPQRLNLLITSRDLVAVDAFASRLLGFDPSSIKYIRLSSKRGLGSIDSTVYGDHVENLSFDTYPTSRIIVRMFDTLASIGMIPTQAE